MKRLCGIISGISHSGTTLLGNALTAGREVFCKFEIGFLLKSTLSGDAFTDPLNDIDRVCHGQEYLDSLRNVYGLTEEEIFFCGEADSWHQAYNRFFDICFRKSDRFCYEKMIDKTPVYGRNLKEVHCKIPDIPIVFTYCDPRKFASSAMKRNGTDFLDASVDIWRVFMKKFEQFEQGFPKCALPVCFEKMIVEPETVFHDVCALFGIKYSSAMLDLSKSIDATEIINIKISRDTGIDRSRIFDYRNNLTDMQQQYILERTADLKKFWYESLEEK